VRAFDRHGKGAVAAAIAGGVTLLAVAAALLAPSHGGGEPAAAPRARLAEASPPAAASPTAEPAATVERLELPGDSAQSEAAASGRLDDAVERTLAALARDLLDPNWSRTSWDVEVRSLAASLPQGASELLARRFSDPASAATTAIVVAEMLRVLKADGAGLHPAASVALLRATAFEGDGLSSSSQAAARSLAWLADEGDLTRLIGLLLEPGADARRVATSWELRATASELVVPALLRELRARAGATLDDRAAELALITLDEALRGTSSGRWPPDVTGDAAALLEKLLTDPKLGEPARLRLLATSATLAAQEEGSRGAALLRACVDDDKAPAERRLRAAELLRRLPRDAAPVERRAALDHLLAVARDGATARERRLAWWALAGDEDDSIAPELRALLQSEHDAAVRQVATGTLDRR
jgi:hypothetical protein